MGIAGLWELAEFESDVNYAARFNELKSAVIDISKQGVIAAAIARQTETHVDEFYTDSPTA